MDYYQDRREHEEFLVGAIKPLSSVLTGIFITPETETYCREHDADLIEGHKDFRRTSQSSAAEDHAVSQQRAIPQSPPKPEVPSMFDQSPPT